MCKKLVFLTVMVMMLTMVGSAPAALQIKVDLVVTQGGEFGSEPVDWTFKGAEPGFEEWSPLLRWGNDKETHDAGVINNIGGFTDLNMGMGMGNGSSAPGTVLDFSAPGDGRLCNTWMRTGSGPGDAHIVLGGAGLIPGTYWVYGYHNSVTGSEPNMPRVYVRTYTGGLQNFGVPADPDGEGVIVEANDVNVPINHVTDDSLLEANRSLVKFYTDGSAVHITYEAAPGARAVLNAMILVITTAPVESSDPSPRDGGTNVCPAAELIWEPGNSVQPVDGHDVYFGTDFNDVNDATTSVGLGVYIDSIDDPCYDPPGDLDFGQTYYWRVDAVNDANANSPWKGNVWSFTVESGQASNPSPPDNSVSVETDTLSWTSSCLATRHDVYFGTDFDDVNDATTNDFPDPYLGDTANTSLFFGPLLEPGVKYYWRIDEKSGSTILAKGDVWNFRARGGTIAYFSFDGVIDTNLPDFLEDDTGNITFEKWGNLQPIYGETNPLSNTAGTSALFVQTDGGGSNGTGAFFHSAFGPDPLDLDSDAYTIEAWVRQDDAAGNIDDDDMEGTVVRKDRFTFGLGVDDDGTVKFMHAGNVIAPEFQPIALGEWHHIAGVYDSSDTDRTEKLYIDGLVVADNNQPGDNPPDDYATDHVGIGAYRLQGTSASQLSNRFNGAIDELRFTDIALPPEKFLIRGDLGLAWFPIPPNGKTEVTYGSSLTWKPGDYASSHDVYFGASYDDVDSADTSSGEFKGNQEPNEYDPGTLATLDGTYYWRIDEVNDSNGFVWKGSTWKYTVANYLVIDDMESYDLGANNIYFTWIDGFVNGTGAGILLGTKGFLPVHGGRNSMEYTYYNDFAWDGSYWAKADYNFDSSQDWTETDVKLMTIFFYGNPANPIGAINQLSVGVEGTSASVEVDLPDMNDLLVEEWQEWNIELSDFAAAPLTAVDTIYLIFGDSSNTTTPGGVGTVYFDDIRLYPPKCVPSLGPALDFSGDCLVGLAEIAMMGDEWLLRDTVISPLVAPSASVLHYALDESSGSSVADSAGSHTGLFFNDVNQTPADMTTYMDSDSVSGNSIHFSHNDDANLAGIKIPTAVFGSISQEITLAMWIKNVHDGETPDGDAFLLEFREWIGSPDANERVIAVGASGNGDTYTFHDSSESISYDQEWDDIIEWTHYSFVRDAADLKIYVNGLLEEVDDSNGTAMATPGLMYLGLSADRALNNTSGLHDGFTGNIDDFMIFDYALNDAQAGYLGTAGTGYVPMPPATMDLYDGEAAGEKAVNFKDYAVLMDSWLEEILWPE